MNVKNKIAFVSRLSGNPDRIDLKITICCFFVYRLWRTNIEIEVPPVGSEQNQVTAVHALCQRFTI